MHHGNTSAFESSSVKTIPKPTVKFTSEQELHLLLHIAESLKIDKQDLFAEHNRAKVKRWIEFYSSKMSYLNFASIMRLMLFDGQLGGKLE